MVVLMAGEAYDARVISSILMIWRGRQLRILVHANRERFYEQDHYDTADHFRRGAHVYARFAGICEAARIGAGSTHRPGSSRRIEESHAMADIFGRLHRAAAQSFETIDAAKCLWTCAAMDFPNRYPRHSGTWHREHAARGGRHFVCDREQRSGLGH